MTQQVSTISAAWHRRLLQERLMQYDWVLLGSVFSLVITGIVMVFSASYSEGLLRVNPDGLYFVKRHLFALTVGMMMLVFLAVAPYTVWADWSGLLFSISILALCAVLILGVQAFGSQRLLFRNSIQPSEVAKLTVILFGSHWLSSKGTRILARNSGLYPYGLLIGFVTLLIAIQPDFTMAILIFLTAFVLFYLASGNLKEVLVVGVIALASMSLFLLVFPYLGDRIENFITALSDPVNSPGWQERNTVRATIRGGLWGSGIGQGEMKTLWLVLPWTDAIFAVVSEETGFVGTMLIILLFGLIVYRGICIAYAAVDDFGFLVAVGITFLLVTQALLHISVVLNLLPVTGITLPFISYGGSSLFVWLSAMGILANIDHTARIQQSA